MDHDVSTTDRRAEAQVTSPRRSWVAPWPTVILLAVLLAYADGFWMVSLRGAIGPAIGPEGPFMRWLVDSTEMLPFFVIAVLFAYARAHRRYGETLAGPRAVIGTGLRVVLAGSVVGLVGLVVSAGWEYHQQSQQVELVHAIRTPSGAVAQDSCPDLCDTQKHEILTLHVRGVRDAGGVLVLTNLLLVGWVIALRGGEVEANAQSDHSPRETGPGPKRDPR